MELTPDQIQQLFVFTEKKRVKYYDLQVELVDHLAERIEEKINSDASFDFEKALQSVYKDFGIFGFSKIVQEKSEHLRKQNNKRIIREIKNLFRWPEFISSALLGLFIWTMVNFIDRIIVDILVVCFITTSLVMFYLIRSKFKPNKKLMMVEFMPDHWGLFPFLYHIFFLEEFLPFNEIAFTIFIFSAVIFQIACFRIGKKLRAEAQINYPEVFALSGPFNKGNRYL